MEGMGSQFPPGFRFHPTDQELIIHYLRKKITATLSPLASIIADVDLYKFDPWDLPEKALFGEGEWFFFSPRDRKYPNGARPNRAAASGYWKATGTDKPILAAGGSHCLGVKKALVFYMGRPPKGSKTDWLDDWVLCRVRQKGCLPAQAEEEHESPGLYHHLTNIEKPVIGERSNLFQGSDYELLSYLLHNPEEGESGGENSDRSSGMASYRNCAEGVQSLHQVLDTIKRKLSFGALDELMLLPSSKRMNYAATGFQSSPPDSVSIDQA